MKKENAGERKRTVTLTVGPGAEQLVELLIAKFEDRIPGIGLTATGILSIAAGEGLKKLASGYALPLPKGWSAVGD